MSKPTKTDAVERNALGQVVAGSGAINPGGLTKEQREAQDWMRTRLIEDKEKVHAALISGIQEGNPLLIKYAHEQLHGKAKELVDLGQDGASLLAVMLGHYRALSSDKQAAIEEELERKAR